MAGEPLALVRYCISTTLPPARRAQLAEVLDIAGAKAVALDNLSLTHFITSSLPSSDSLETLPDTSAAEFVTPLWVERTRVLEAAQPAEYYSPDPAMLFSGLTATATGLSAPDLELLCAAISALGGQWRATLTKDVTHVFALASGSLTYETAMQYREKTGMCVLVPHWFEDTIRLGIRGLPTKEYEWPDPAVFKGPYSAEEQKALEKNKTSTIPKDKKSFFDSALASDAALPIVRAAPRNVWNGLRVLLSASLGFTASQRSAHEADITREGGVVVELEETDSRSSDDIARDEVEKVQRADVFVTRYRAGQAFAEAFRSRKTIGTLTWLWYVRATGVLSRPADHLLHYPIPKKPIEGFNHIITITNYTGKHRDYLKKIISTMGAQFTPSMTANNTVLVAAYLSGSKTEKAVSWSIPVVNHTWIEDCFAQWRALTPAQERYIIFPPRIDFSTLLADRGMGGRIGFESDELEAMEIDEDNEGLYEVNGQGADVPGLTANSASDAREVEDVIMIENEVADVSIGGYGEVELGMQMNVDDDGQRPRRRPGSKQPPTSHYAERNRAEPPEHSVSDTDLQPEPLPSPQRGRNTVRKSGRDASEVQNEDERRSASPRRQTRKKRVRSIEGDDYVDERRVGRSNTDKAQPSTSKRRLFTSPSSNEDENEMDIDNAPRARSSTVRKRDVQTKKTAARARRMPSPHQTDEESGGENAESGAKRHSSHSSVPATIEPSRTSRTPVSPMKISRTPKKKVSVLMPTVADVYSPNKFGSSRPTKTVSRTGSLHAEAEHRSPEKGARTYTSVAKRDKVERRHETGPVSPAPKSRRRDSTSAPAGPAHADVSSSTLTRSPSKRSAANKANTKLRDEIMPDVMNFQREMKRGNVRAAWEEASQSSAKSKGKESRSDAVTDAKSSKSHSRKRTSLAQESDASLPDEGEHDRKRQRTKPASTQKGKTPRRRPPGGKKDQESSDDEDIDKVPKLQSRRKSAGDTKDGTGDNNTIASKARPVRIMTTQITVSDDVIRVLAKLGAKMTTKPSECTHLVTRNLVRTEKFLCAMAVAPFIVNEKWLLSSAAAKQLLPEERYAIKDPENEEKYGFQLSDALRRASANGGKLFAGMTFYVTPKVPVDTKLLKNVVTAGGGQLLTQTPSVRILKGNENRYVISSPADVSIWRPLAEQGYPIYNQELILTGTLKQEIDWNSPINKVTS